MSDKFDKLVDKIIDNAGDSNPTSTYQVESKWDLKADMPCPTKNTPANASDITTTVKPLADSIQHLNDHKLEKTARAADSSKLNGKAEADLVVKSAGTSTTCSGNAGSATKLQNARQINGVAFDGTKNITIPTDAPSSVHVFAYASDVTKVKLMFGSTVKLTVVNPTTGIATYNKPAGVSSLQVWGVGSGEGKCRDAGVGAGGGSAFIYIHNPGTRYGLVVANSLEKNPKATSFHTLLVAKSGYNNGGGTGQIASPYPGMIADGGQGDNFGGVRQGGIPGFALCSRVTADGQQGCFPGGAGTANGWESGGNGIIVVMEYGKVSTTEELDLKESEPLKEIYNGKRYAMLSGDNQWVTCIVTYDPTDWFIPGTCIECPDYVDINSQYINGKFTTPAPDHRELYDYDWKKQEWILDKEKNKEFQRQSLIEVYVPALDKLKSALAAAFALEEEEELKAIKIVYKATEEEFKSKMKDIDSYKKVEINEINIFCPVCGQLLDLDKKGKKYCSRCGWKE